MFIMIKLRQCAVNPNHWYSLHSNNCPWCRILAEQGSDYFPSQDNPVNLPAFNETARPDLPNPVSQPALPQKQLGTYSIRFIAILVIGIIVIACIFALPSAQSKPVVSDPVTPHPTTIIPAQESRPVMTTVPTPGENGEVSLPYRETIPLNYGTATRSFQSDTAPIQISVNTEPKMITDKKVFFTGTDDPGTEIEVTRVDENAYWKITVRNLADGNVVTEDGYGKMYSSEPLKVIKILKDGRYAIDITGSKTIVSLAITA
jgi:hypothetical protein